MSFKKHISPKHSFQSTNSELDKLEKTQRSELRMISTAAFKFRSKFIKAGDLRGWRGENEASSLRMYETHFPGFCYLRDGKYRKKVMHANKGTAVSVESSGTIRALLFTENELDIHKVLCLHLLGTHAQNRRHMQRKDGRLCIFIRSHNQGHKRLAVQSISRRNLNDKKVAPANNDEVLPRYILEVRPPDRNLLCAEVDSHFDENAGKKKPPQVLVYVNNDIQAIVSSVIEALKTVNSSKLKELIALARDPEKIREMLSREDIQQYITELGGSHLTSNPNAYNVIITHPKLEKVPDPSSAEIVSQILDIPPNSDMRNMLNLVRKTICRRYEELVPCYVLPGKKKRTQGGKGSIFRNASKTSFSSCETSTKTSYLGFTSGAFGSDYRIGKYLAGSSEMFKHEDTYKITVPNEPKIEKNSNVTLQHGMKWQKKVESHSSEGVFHRSAKEHSSKPFPKMEEFQMREKSTLSDGSADKIEGRIQQLKRFYDNDINKYDFKNLNNSQRILLGLKIASLKNRPVNMHQFENKKQVDVMSLITSIMRPNKPDPTTNFWVGDDPEGRKTKKAMDKVEHYRVQGLGNLTRAVLSNLMHDIATAENKKRVEKFMEAPL